MTKILSLAMQPKWSRLGAIRVQNMPGDVRIAFVHAMELATTTDELPEPYKGYLLDGYSSVPFGLTKLQQHIAGSSEVGITFPTK